MGISFKGVLVVLLVAFGLATLFWFEKRGTVPANPQIEAEFKRETDCQAMAQEACARDDRACTTRTVAACVRVISAD